MEQATTPLAVNATDLPRIMSCIGSIYMPASPAPSLGDNTVRNEGDAAHWLIECTANGEGVDIGASAPNGIKITDEMLQHVKQYFETVTAYGGTAVTEVDCTYVDPREKFRIDARADRVAYNDETQTLHVDDFKYGWSIVEPEWNWTLIAYVLGYLQRFDVRPQYIVLTIHQPRPWHVDGPVRSWEMSAGDLIEARARITEQLRNPRMSTYSNPHCGRCHANALCPAARKSALNAIDVADAAHREDMTGEALSAELDLLTRAHHVLKDRLEAIRELAHYRIKTGKIVPNYSSERTFSNRKWLDGLDAKTLHMMTGVDLSDVRTVTPAEAERRGVSKQVVNSLTDRVPTGVQLVRIDIDKKARKMFK